MEFSDIVRQIQQLHVQQGQHWKKEVNSQTLQNKTLPPEAHDFDVIYGRVCTTRDGDPPVMLSADFERKTVFVFGPDAIKSVFLRLPIDDVLYSLGYDKQYLYHKIVKEKQTFWVVLFTLGSLSTHSNDTISVVPATWDGVIQHVQLYFPKAMEDLLMHIQTLKENDFEDFERDAHFQFLDSKNNNGMTNPEPPYFGYEHFTCLPKPRSAWQVRAFLYCELRLFKLYSGDGYTMTEGGRGRNVLEYLCPNVHISHLAATAKCVALPIVPVIGRRLHRTC